MGKGSPSSVLTSPKNPKTPPPHTYNGSNATLDATTPMDLDSGSRGVVTKRGGTSNVSSKQMICKVMLLDDSVVPFQVPYKSVSKVLFDQICQSLNLLETDYFGVEYFDNEGNKCWLDNEKFIINQVGMSGDVIFKFCVKFYTPDPTQLEEEYTRYLFCLQLKRDLADGSMPCSENTTALLASYIVQADCGDYSYEDYPDHTYLSGIQFVPKQTSNLEIMIMDNHKKHAGQTPAEADLNFLDIARRVEMYGIKMHPAQDHEGVGLNLAVAHMGILVYQNMTRINTFSWAKIRKLSFKRKKFLIKLHPEEYGYYKDTVEFYFQTRNQSKNFWKKCIEHHTFFRVVNNFPISAEKPNVRHKRAKIFSKGSSFRYSGRTQKEIVAFVRDSFINRQPFTRSLSSHLSIKSAASPNSQLKSSSSTGADTGEGTGLGQTLATPAGVPYYGLNNVRSETRLSKASSTSGSHMFDTSAEDVTMSLQNKIAPHTSLADRITDVTRSPSIPNGPLLLAQSSQDGSLSVSFTQNDTTAPIVSEMEEEILDEEPIPGRKISRGEQGCPDLPVRGFDSNRRLLDSSMRRPNDTDFDLYNVTGITTTSLNRRNENPVRNNKRKSAYEIRATAKAQGTETHHLADLSMALDEYCGNMTFERNNSESNIASNESILQSLFHLIKEMLMTEVTYCKDLTILIQQLVDIVDENGKRRVGEKILKDDSYNEQKNVSENCGHPYSDQIYHSHIEGTARLDPIFLLTSTLNNILPYHKDIFRPQLEFKMAWWERINKGRRHTPFDRNLEVNGDGFGDNSLFYEKFLIDVADVFVLQNGLINHYGTYFENVPKCLRSMFQSTSFREIILLPDGQVSYLGLIGENFYQHLLDDDFLGAKMMGNFAHNTCTNNTDKMIKPLLAFRSYLSSYYLMVKPFYRVFYYHDIMTSLLYRSHRLGHTESLTPLYSGIISSLSNLKHIALEILHEIESYIFNIDLESNVYIEPSSNDSFTTDMNLLKRIKIQPNWGSFVRHGQVNSLKTIADIESTQNVSYRNNLQDKLHCNPLLIILFEKVLLMAERMEPAILTNIPVTNNTTNSNITTGLYESKFSVTHLLKLSHLQLEYDLDDDDHSTTTMNYDKNHYHAIPDKHYEEQSKQRCNLTIRYNSSNFAISFRSQVDKYKWINDLQKCINGDYRSNNHNLNKYLDEEPSPLLNCIQVHTDNKDSRDLKNYIVGLGLNISWHRHLTIGKEDLKIANMRTISGYLLRKYKNNAGWQKLWVVYANFYLFFYKDHDDLYPLANLPLPGYQISLPPSSDPIHKENVFRLMFKNHIYYFRTDTHFAFQRWMDIIKITCDRIYKA